MSERRAEATCSEHTDDVDVEAEALRLARHQVRNHLTTILNAAHFLKLKVRGSELAQDEPRIERFLYLIEKSVADAHGALDALRDARVAVDESES